MPDELFDVVDENDKIIRQEMRSVVHQRGLWHRGAHVLLFTSDDKLIVQQRAKNKSQSPLALDCSVSEHVLAGETFYEAAVRGLKEELGITNISIQPLVKFKMNYGPNDNEISMIFKGVSGPDLVHFDPDEIEKVDYLDAQELEQLMLYTPAMLSRWFLQILLWFFDKPSDLIIIDGVQTNSE